MSKKLYVGNLVFSVDNAKLKEIFASYGEIEDAIVIVDKFSNRSKGFGFVTFSNDENADKAISEMNEKEVEGRKLTVNEARPMEERSDDRPRRNFNDRGGGFGGNRDRGNRGGFGGNRDRGRRY
ncbi:MAG: RNA-binding protein [Nanoarchaeota archaeon]|nr:RNA-binding protein [Nanoarchaeota archaeon]